MSDDSDYLIEQLGSHHNRAAFCCGTEALNRYVHQQMKQDAGKRVAAPFVLCKKDSADVVGFYTLSQTSINLSELPPEIAKKLPRYPVIPATLIGRLAIDQSYRGRGLGGLILLNALYRSFKNEIASFAVVVDAKDDKAASFYKHYDFICFPENSSRLFLPMKTIEKSFVD